MGYDNVSVDECCVVALLSILCIPMSAVTAQTCCFPLRFFLLLQRRALRTNASTAQVLQVAVQDCGYSRDDKQKDEDSSQGDGKSRGERGKGGGGVPQVLLQRHDEVHHDGGGV